jgi:hypothetical protein
MSKGLYEEVMIPNDQPSPEPQEDTCPWCPDTGNLKQLMRHMASAYHSQ